MLSVIERHYTWFGRLFRDVFLVAVFLVAFAGCQAGAATDATAERQALVATRGVEVMPFDLERTTHIFEKREDGGIQQVIADEVGDDEQVALIRAHLVEEAERFEEGDFHDPSLIHGEDMAGLDELMMGAARIEIVYSELPDGGQISYVSDDPELVAAIHAWFDAQVADHGDHASSGH